MKTSKIINIISQKRENKNFADIINNFETILSKFYTEKRTLDLEKYFGIGKGQITTKKLLIENKKINDDWLYDYKTEKGNIKTDFKGLYIFINEETPFYIGISKGVIGRIQQHLKGSNHNTATLAFKIGRKIHKKENQNKSETRNDVDFKSKIEPVKEFLMKQKIVLIPIKDDDELALFEIYCSIKLRTKLNSFETH